jgi:hypothetical protein
MPIEAREEAPDIVCITMRGRMTPADHATLLFFIAKTVEGARRVRLLILLEDFEGWTTDEEWADDALRLENDAVIIKAAIVGERRWKDQIFAFVARPFRKIPIEYFTSEVAARSWLNA